MRVIFKEDALRELYEIGKTKERKYKLVCKKKKLVEGFQRAVSIMYDSRIHRTAKDLQFSSLRTAKVSRQGTKELIAFGKRHGRASDFHRDRRRH